jgi:hypothetical protein
VSERQGRIPGDSRIGLLAIIFVVSATLLISSTLFYGAPLTHSHVVNSAWQAGFSQEIWSGNLVPRWLPNMTGAAGGPDFYFYAPAFFYLSVLRTAVLGSDVGPQTQIIVGVLLVTLLSMVAFYCFIRSKVTFHRAAISAVLYAALPYHLIIDFYMRGALAEMTALAIVPLCFLSLQKLAGGWRGAAGFAVSYAILALSHLPVALLVAIASGLFVVASERGSLRWRALFRLGIAGIGGVGLAGYYVIPALTLQPLVNIGWLWSDYYDYDTWFLYFRSESADSILMPAIDVYSTALFGVCLTVLICERVGKIRLARQDVGLLVIGFSLFFLMTPLSKPIWILLPPLQKIQFPWRATGIVEFAVLALVTRCLFLIKINGVGFRRLQISLAAMFVGLVASLPTLWPSDTFVQHANPEVAERLLSEAKLQSSPPEYFPAAISLSPNEIAETVINQPTISTADDVGTVEAISLNGRRMVFKMSLTADTVVEVRQFWFPGLAASIANGGALQAVTPTRETEKGLINVSVPAGNYELELRRDYLREEKIGFVVSLITLLLISSVAIYVGLFGEKGLGSRRAIN